jgi:hypothetical protein
LPGLSVFGVIFKEQRVHQSTGGSFSRSKKMATTTRAFVVYQDNVVECDVRFEEYEGPCRVLKSCAPAYVHVDEVVSAFRWAVTLDHARHIAVTNCEAQVAEHVEFVKLAEDAHKKSSADWSARDVTDAKAALLRMREKLRYTKSVSPHEGPTMFRMVKVTF